MVTPDVNVSHLMFSSLLATEGLMSLRLWKLREQPDRIIKPHPVVPFAFKQGFEAGHQIVVGRLRGE